MVLWTDMDCSVMFGLKIVCCGLGGLFVDCNWIDLCLLLLVYAYCFVLRCFVFVLWCLSLLVWRFDFFVVAFVVVFVFVGFWMVVW